MKEENQGNKALNKSQGNRILRRSEISEPSTVF